MRKILSFALVLAGAFLFTPTARGQARILLGATGGDVYSNVFGGAAARAELPIGSRFEIDADGQISPHFDVNSYEISLLHKVGLGSGNGYSYGVTGRWWFTPYWSLDGQVEASEYSVTKTSKKEYFSEFGFSHRTLWFGGATRFGFHYVREFANGIMANGDETNFLNGGSVTIDTRVGCTWKLCFRLFTDVQAGRVLNQGNPTCDGTSSGAITCPRSSTVAGGASVSLYLEFPRRQEWNLF